MVSDDMLGTKATPGSLDGTAGHPLRVLLVEDSEADAELVVRALRQGGHELHWDRVESAAALQRALATGEWDLILADYSLPQFGVPEALEILHASRLDLPFIIVSGQVGEEAAVAAMKAGAHDYIMKDHLARLVPAVERELREAAGRREHHVAESLQREEAEVSAALVQVGRALISSLDTPVLLDRLCQLTAEVVRCDASLTLLYRPDDEAFVAVSGHGYSPEEWEPVRVLRVPRRMMKPLLEWLQRDELVVLDMEQFRALPLAAISLRYGVRHAVAVGLRRGDDIVAVHIAAYRNRERPFSARQCRVFQGIGQFASLALAHAQVVEELERASRLKSDFVATMSHELRTPLNVIIGYVDLLIEKEFGDLTIAEVDCLRRVEKSAHELLDLINATLNLSRLEGGRVTLELGDVDLRQLLIEIESETHDLLAKNGLTFACTVSQDVPLLHSDAVKLKVVLKNLIANALKFTHQGGVTVQARRAADGVEVAVRDSGIGIAPEALNVIFEPFRQVDSSSTRRYGGVGLGLYIARRLVELLGGTVSVESAVGRGSTFRVWVPLDVGGVETGG